VGRRSANYPPELRERAGPDGRRGAAGLPVGLSGHRGGGQPAGDRVSGDAAQMSLGPSRIWRVGLTCWSTLGARSHPPCLLVHGPGIRLAGAPIAQCRRTHRRDTFHTMSALHSAACGRCARCFRLSPPCCLRFRARLRAAQGPGRRRKLDGRSSIETYAPRDPVVLAGPVDRRRRRRRAARCLVTGHDQQISRCVAAREAARQDARRRYRPLV
jgi:hypothetical protein